MEGVKTCLIEYMNEMVAAGGEEILYLVELFEMIDPYQILVRNDRRNQFEQLKSM